MSVLLTGASGFVGMNVLEELLARGLPVVSFTNTPLPLRPGHGPRQASFVSVQGDVRDRDAVDSVMRQYRVERVIHAAAITSDASRERSSGDDIISVNVGGTATVAAAAARHGVERFVLVGSVAVYGSSEAKGHFSSADHAPSLLVEEMPHNPVSLYDLSKSSCETIIGRIADLNGLNWSVGRLGTVFGPWERDTGFRDTLSAVFQVNQLAISGGHAWLDRPSYANWHYARDAARSLVTLAMADAPRHRIYNLGPSICWTLSAWCELLTKRFPAFTFAIGGRGGKPINVYEAEDSPLLSWQRFTDEFGPTARFDLERAFDDYFEWIDASSG